MRRAIIALCLLAAVVCVASPRRLLMARHRSAAAGGTFPTDGLICHYDMSTNASPWELIDTEGNINAVLTNAVTFNSTTFAVDGVGARKYDANAYANMGELSSYPDMTVAFWHKHDEVVIGGAAGNAFGTRKNFGTARGISATDLGATQWYVTMIYSYTVSFNTISNLFTKAGTWIHITAAWDVSGGEARLWTNGVVAGEVTGVSVGSPNNTYPYYLFTRYNNTTYDTYPSRGKYDEFYMWNRVLTDDEVKTVYEEFTP